MDKKIVIIILCLLHLGQLQAQMKYFNKIIDIPRSNDSRFYAFGNARFVDIVDSQIIVMGRIFDSTYIEKIGLEKFIFISVDKEGNYINHALLYDTTLDIRTHFQYDDGFLISPKTDNKLLLFGANYDLQLDKQEFYLYELDKDSGAIESRIKIRNIVDSLQDMGTWILLRDSKYNEVIVLSRSIRYDNPDIPITGIVTIFDSTLQIIREEKIPAYYEAEVRINPFVLHAQRKKENDNLIVITEQEHVALNRDRRFLFRYIEINEDGEFIVDNIYDKMPDVGKRIYDFKAEQMPNEDWLMYMEKYSLGARVDYWHPILVRMNADFTDTVWTSEIDFIPHVAFNYLYAASYCHTADSSHILGLMSSIVDGESPKAWVHKTNLEDGSVTYIKQLDILNSIGDRATLDHITRTPDGGYLLTGNAIVRQTIDGEEDTPIFEI